MGKPILIDTEKIPLYTQGFLKRILLRKKKYYLTKIFYLFIFDVFGKLYRIQISTLIKMIVTFSYNNYIYNKY